MDEKPIIITNADLRKRQYPEEVLAYNIDNVRLKTILTTQKLSPEFCAKYIMDYEDEGCDDDFILAGYILLKQPHITEEQLYKAWNNYRTNK